ncbi:MAG TPA: ThuA domain-containing protein [Mobilitalea sp.]|nr:ThuA domain-containing protein [Mobilitalea sp.]
MKRALIFQGGWDGHEPVLVSGIFKKILVEGGFDVELYDNLDCLADAGKLKEYDLIVPVWTMGTIDGQYVRNVCEAVSGGTGIAGCHGGMCDSFRDNVEWQFMTGSQWVAHPGNDGVEYMVHVSNDDYFTKGLKDFKVCSEQYYLHVDPAVKVYATTTFPVIDGPHATNGKVNMPVVYTKMWGEGKVFYTSLGHHADIFNIPEAYEIMKRGLLWAAR